MTDAQSPTSAPSAANPAGSNGKKEEKKPTTGGNGNGSTGGTGGGRGAKRAPPVRSNSINERDRESRSISRSGSQGSQKRPSATTNAGNGAPPEGASSTAAEPPKKAEGRPRREGSLRGGAARRSQPPTPAAPVAAGQSRPRQAQGLSASIHAPKEPAALNTALSTSPSSASPAQGPSSASPPQDALTSLQKMINDMKTLPSSTGPTSPPSATAPSVTGGFHSSLPANAPVFQPGAATYPPPQDQSERNEPPPRHRKAVSMGAQAPPSFTPSFGGAGYPMNTSASFASHLGPMMEDAEDTSPAFEEGEISDQQQTIYSSGQQAPQGPYTAPRFAALAAQQRQQQQPPPPQEEAVGPSGRPQLAPTFVFGARRRNASAAGAVAGLGPAIGEEDEAYKVPQGQQFESQGVDGLGMGAMPGMGGRVHGRTQSEMPSMTGLMAEQIALQNQIEALQQQQQQLLQQQFASGAVLPSFPATLTTSQLPAAAARNAAHRRIQSQQVPMGSFGMQTGFDPSFGQPQLPPGLNPLGIAGGMPFGMPGMNGQQQMQQQQLQQQQQQLQQQQQQMQNLQQQQQQQQQGVGRAHGRRHSVNVVPRGHQAQPSLAYNFPYDGFEDGFAPPGAHTRQASRADSNWRINGGAGAIQSDSAFSPDLAQAQAQLQSLQQFRAASGGHHQKMASFSFPNMLPNVMAANMMGLGFLQQQNQQIQQFQMQLQQQSNQPQRKSLFAPYLPQASLPPLLAAGKLVVGILRVNKRNRSDAYVSTEVLDADIYICGSKDRNRALEGDIVAVELLDVDEVWGTKKEKEEKKRKKEENAAFDSAKLAAGKKNDKKKDDVEVEGQGLMLFEDEEVTDDIKPQFAGHVVAVVERMPSQLFSGTLGLLRPSSAATKEKQEAERREREGDKEPEEKRGLERPKIVWFKPTDKRVPLIAIPTEQAPADFIENQEAYANKLFVACIKRHPISSLHPFGTLVEELGPIGDVEVETSALLKDCNFPTEDFSDNVLKCLPPLPWAIPEREYDLRRDMRADRTFTIDPETAKDLDDALSIKTNEDGTFDVSVHIADVSYFVKPNTALDRDARKRATSVYLVQRAVPMLPPALSEELCSLVPGVERLAFSAVFTMTAEGKVISTWFGRTVIKSAAKLAYEHAQAVIEGRSLGGVTVSPEHTASEIEADIKQLHELAVKLRQARVEAGTLRIDSMKLLFKLDENGRPSDCSPYERKEANSLIEEFMLLANMSVAKAIAANLPEQALLRRHEEPIARRLDKFAEHAKRLGVSFDTSSAGAMQASFDAMTDPALRRQLEILSTKAMHRAKYFCSGMLDIAKYQHYALNAALYTHFTSPIRRYADVLVHRQLDCVLQGDAENKFNMDRDAVAKLAQQCNIKRDSAKLAQEQSAHLYLCLLISDLTQLYGPVVRNARVVGVLDAAFDVFVPDFGIEKRVHVDQMPIENHVYEEHSHTLQIYWTEKEVIAWLAEQSSDDPHLQKVRRTAEQHARARAQMEVTSRQPQDESALFEEPEDEEAVQKESGEDEADKGSKQRALSKKKEKPVFEGLRTTPGGHKIQDIKESMQVPVIVTADLTKSPPVIKVYSVNPYAAT